MITPVGRWEQLEKSLFMPFLGAMESPQRLAGPGFCTGRARLSPGDTGRGAGFPKSCRMQVSWGDGGEPHCSDGPWGGRYSRAPGTARFCFLEGRFTNTPCVSCLRASPRLLRAPGASVAALELSWPRILHTIII